MKKTGIAVLALLLFFCVSGCGKDDESIVEEPEWEQIDESSGMAEGGSNAAGSEGNLGENSTGGMGESGNNGSPEDGKGQSADISAEYASLVEGLIAEQSFEVELDGWGKVFFASATPSGDGGAPRFMLLKEKEVVYTFPETQKNAEDKFVEVGAVAFQDYNKDGKKDIIALVTYNNGTDKWNQPVIFLQENSDNMFYLDHPELKDYQVVKEAGAGAAFYRDTFLEKYLKEQNLTGSVASFSGSWTDYVDYADSLSGYFSTEKQIELFAKNRQVWAEGMDYANEIHRFTVAGLGYDGKLTLIVSNQGGTGMYTYSEFYQIDENGELKRLETSFREGDSQPDIIVEDMMVYSSFSNKDGMRNYFIAHDMLKSPDSYVYRVSSLCLQDDFVMETPLARQTVVYEGEDSSGRIESEDCNGNSLTEEEYENFADKYYSNMGMTKHRASFSWVDVSSLNGMSDEEAEAELERAYDGFSLD